MGASMSVCVHLENLTMVECMDVQWDNLVHGLGTCPSLNNICFRNCLPRLQDRHIVLLEGIVGPGRFTHLV